MVALSYTDMQPGVFFRMDGAVYEVLGSTFSKKSRQKGSNQVRIRNIVSGATVSKTLRASDSLEEVRLEKESFVFVYAKGDEMVLHPQGVPSERITVSVGAAGRHDLIPSGTVVVALVDKGVVQAVQFPIKTELKVKDAPPSVRGNTAQGGTKKVTLETGAVIAVPLFIEAGDVVRINTETGAYVERVTKA